MSTNAIAPEINSGKTGAQICENDNDLCDGPDGDRLPCFDCYAA